jgi:type II secretory pathway component PulF
MTWDLDALAKISEMLGAGAAVVAAWQAWNAHSEAKESRNLLTQIRAEVTAKQSVVIYNNPSQTLGPPTANENG